MDNYPLVSCLCVTKNRPEYLKRVINCFNAQTYPNKELVVVYEQEDIATKIALENIDATKVEVSPHENLRLGELRNRAIEQSRGEYFCQWDDDDWYHVDRLKIQMQSIAASRQVACTLTNWILYDEETEQAYFSVFRLWEGSILCRRNVITAEVNYPNYGAGEDTLFLNKLIAKHGIYPEVKPNLYIYRVHKNNTWGDFRNHFSLMYSQAQKLSPATSSLIGRIMNDQIDIEQASAILDSPEFIQQFRYFDFNNLNYSNEQVLRYMESVKQVNVKEFVKKIGRQSVADSIAADNRAVIPSVLAASS